MKIKGTGKSETLNGTTGTDYIDGGAGNDTINGGVGADYLIGGRGADTFVFDSNSQFDTIADFNPAEGDRIQFGTGGSSVQSLYAGQLSDGLSFQVGGDMCYVEVVDINGDGVMDTQLSLNGNNVVLLGWAPEQISGSYLVG